MAADGTTRGDRPERMAVFAIAAVLVVLYALRGGSYDVVVRGEAGVALWWLLGIGAAAGLLPRARLGRPALVVFAGIALLGAWTLLSFGWTDSDERTSIELARVLHHAAILLLAACALRRGTVVPAVAGIATGAAFVCAVAVGARLFPGSVADDAVRESFGGNRLSYPLNYWNAVGAWGAMTAAMALAWSGHARSLAWRAAALAVVPLSVTTVYLTYSRAGAAGIVVGTALVLAFSRGRLVVALHALFAGGASLVAIEAVRGQDAIAQATGSAGGGTVLVVLLAGMAVCAVVAAALGAVRAEERLEVPRRTAGVLTAVGAVVAVVGGILLLPPVVERTWDDFSSGTDQVNAAEQADPAARLASLDGTRYTVWSSALDEFRSDPLTGTGPGTFEFWWNRDAQNAETVRDAHSLYLEALGETGWPGLLFVVLLVGGGLAAAVVARRQAADRTTAGACTAAVAAIGLWAFHAGVDWMWESTAVTVLALLLIGAMLPRTDLAPRPRVAFRLVAAVACLLAVLAQLPPVVGTSRIRDSQRAVARGDLGAAREAAEDALAAWPWAASPYVQRALVSETRGALRGALVDVRRAERREPDNWRHPLVKTRLYAEAGRPKRALAAFRRARELRPLSPVFR